MTAVIWKVLHPFKYPGLRVSAMCTRWNGKGGELSSQASKMLYKLPGAVNIASYKEPPGKIRTGILVGSRHDLNGNPAEIPARFWPQGFFLSAGIPAESRQDSHRGAKFQPGSCRESWRDSCREAKISAANISPGSYRESHWDSHWEATSWRPKSGWDASANLARKQLLGS